MALHKPLNMTEMRNESACSLEGSLRPNTMHFAQGSNWSNRADIVFVRSGLLISPRCYLWIRGFWNKAKEEGKWAFPERHNKNKHRVKQLVRPGVDKWRCGFPPKAALSEMGFLIVSAGDLWLLEACLSCDTRIRHKYYQITALFSIVMRCGYLNIIHLEQLTRIPMCNLWVTGATVWSGSWLVI